MHNVVLLDFTLSLFSQLQPLELQSVQLQRRSLRNSDVIVGCARLIVFRRKIDIQEV
jgi:hypothetical protein